MATEANPFVQYGLGVGTGLTVAVAMWWLNRWKSPASKVVADLTRTECIYPADLTEEVENLAAGLAKLDSYISRINMASLGTRNVELDEIQRLLDEALRRTGERNRWLDLSFPRASRLALPEYCWHGTIVNNGSVLAKSVSIEGDVFRWISVKRAGQKAVVSKGSEAIAIGDLQPKESVEFIGWRSSFMDLDSHVVRHDAGTARLIKKVAVDERGADLWRFVTGGPMLWIILLIGAWIIISYSIGFLRHTNS